MKSTMKKLNTHWTEKSTKDFQHRLIADFVRFIEEAMEQQEMTQSELASLLKVSDGRVSQVLNNPGNLTLNKMIEYARAVGRKISIVGYDDNDPKNTKGPVYGDIFSQCWEDLGKPHSFFELETSENNSITVIIQLPYVYAEQNNLTRLGVKLQPDQDAVNLPSSRVPAYQIASQR